MYCLTKDLNIVQGEYNNDKTKFYFGGFRGSYATKSDIILVSNSKEELEKLKAYNLSTMPNKK